jgi:ubiquinone/menaquinone biosynthesis C-methylase UbiE
MTGHGAASGAVASGFDQAAGDYDTTGTEFFAQVGRRLVTLAGITPGARVLDVGCGKGAATIPAAQAAGPTGQVTGIDTSAAMLEQAATAASRDRLENVTLLQADAEDPPFPGGTADVLLAANVIQLLARPDPHRPAMADPAGPRRDARAHLGDNAGPRLGSGDGRARRRRPRARSRLRGVLPASPV